MGCMCCCWWWDIATAKLPGSWSEPDHGNRAQRHGATEPKQEVGKDQWSNDQNCLYLVGRSVMNKTQSLKIHKSSLALWLLLKEQKKVKTSNSTVHMSADDAVPDGPKHIYTHTSSWQSHTAFQKTNKTKTDEEQAFFTDFHSCTHSNVAVQSDMCEKY